LAEHLGPELDENVGGKNGGKNGKNGKNGGKNGK
jgi:hypothetical protein